jgi:hypothetical protein
VIADALHREFDETHAAVKVVVGLTNANERAVKNWFMAKNGPTGKHLVDLIRISDEVLEAVLIMSGRHELVVAKKFADSKQALIKMLELLRELQGQPTSDPRCRLLFRLCQISQRRRPGTEQLLDRTGAKRAPYQDGHAGAGCQWISDCEEGQLSAGN